MDPLVIKLGGKLVQNPNALTDLFCALSDYCNNTGRLITIVHGGGCMVDTMLTRLQLPIVKSDGQRVTPEDQIDIIVATLAGIANKRLMSSAMRAGLMPLGLCLSDGASTKVERINIKLGCVGCAHKGESTFLQQCMKTGYLPIISSIGMDATGQLLNVNADNAATAIAATLGAELLLLSDVTAVLDENAQPLAILTPKRAQDLMAAGIITAGMKVKVKEALKIAKRLNKSVNIAGIQAPEQLIALFNGTGMATQIRY